MRSFCQRHAHSRIITFQIIIHQAQNRLNLGSGTLSKLPYIIKHKIQSAAKLFDHLRFFSGLIANFYSHHACYKQYKLKDLDWTNIYFEKLH